MGGLQGSSNSILQYIEEALQDAESAGSAEEGEVVLSIVAYSPCVFSPSIWV